MLIDYLAFALGGETVTDTARRAMVALRADRVYVCHNDNKLYEVFIQVNQLGTVVIDEDEQATESPEA